MTWITGWRIWHPRRGYRTSGKLDGSWGSRGHLYATRETATSAHQVAQEYTRTTNSACIDLPHAVVLPAIVLDPTWADLPEAIRLLGSHPLAAALAELQEHAPAVAAAHLGLPGGFGGLEKL